MRQVKFHLAAFTFPSNLEARFASTYSPLFHCFPWKLSQARNDKNGPTEYIFLGRTNLILVYGRDQPYNKTFFQDNKYTVLYHRVKVLINHSHYTFFSFFESNLLRWDTLKMFLSEKKSCQSLNETFRIFSIK